MGGSLSVYVGRRWERNEKRTSEEQVIGADAIIVFGVSYGMIHVHAHVNMMIHHWRHNHQRRHTLSRTDTYSKFKFSNNPKFNFFLTASGEASSFLYNIYYSPF